MKLVETKRPQDGTFVCALEFEDHSPSFARGFEVGSVFRQLTTKGSLGTELDPVFLNADNVSMYVGIADITGTIFSYRNSEVEGWVAAYFTKKTFKPVLV